MDPNRRCKHSVPMGGGGEGNWVSRWGVERRAKDREREKDDGRRSMGDE